MSAGCPDPVALSRWRDGELPADEARVVSAHVDACVGCRDAQAAWRAFEAEASAALASPGLPGDFTAAVIAALAAPTSASEGPLAGPDEPEVARPPTPGDVVTRAAIAAVAVVALVAAAVIGLGRSREADRGEALVVVSPAPPARSGSLDALRVESRAAATSRRPDARPAPAAVVGAIRPRVPAAAVVAGELRQRGIDAARRGSPKALVADTYARWLEVGDLAVEAEPLEGAAARHLVERLLSATGRTTQVAFARAWLAADPDGEAVAVLLDATPEDEAKVELARRFIAAGEEAIERVIDVVGDLDAPLERRRRAAFVLGRVGDAYGSDASTAAALTSLALEPGGLDAAVAALGELGTRSGLEALATLHARLSRRGPGRSVAGELPRDALYASARERVAARRAVIEALARYREPGAVPLLADGLQSASTRKVARAAMSQIVGRDLGGSPRRWKRWWSDRRRGGGGAAGRLPFAPSSSS